MPTVVHPAERVRPRRTPGLRRLAVAALVVLGVGATGAAALAPVAAARTTATDATTTTAARAGATTLPQAATDGSGSTTTTSTESTPDDPAQKQLRLIIIGLVVLAVVVLVLTAVLWRATSPARVVTVAPVEPGQDDDVDEDEPSEPVRLDPFAVALMSPSSPLPPSVAPGARPTAEPPARPAPPRKPSIVVADPVEWPEDEPQRLDLPDPPVFDDDSPDGTGGGTGGEWRGIRPLGPVERGEP
jgi:hypothetical protein